MIEYFQKLKSLGANVKVELDLSNYVRKTDLKNATRVDKSSFAKKTDLASSKSNLDKLDIDKLKNLPSNLSNLKNKVDEIGIGKLETTPVDLNKLSNVVKNDVIKQDVYNAQIKDIEDKIPDITNLATNTSLNVKISQVKGEIPSITDLTPTSTALTAVQNKIHNVSNLIKKTDHNTKICEIEKKITDHDHDKYITTPEFNKLTAESFAARLAQNDIANFIKKTDCDDKLKNLNEVLKKVKLLLTKDHSFLLGRIYFTRDHGYQNMFVFQPTFNVLELKIDRGIE